MKHGVYSRPTSPRPRVHFLLPFPFTQAIRSRYDYLSFDPGGRARTGLAQVPRLPPSLKASQLNSHQQQHQAPLNTNLSTPFNHQPLATLSRPTTSKDLSRPPTLPTSTMGSHRSWAGGFNRHEDFTRKRAPHFDKGDDLIERAIELRASGMPSEDVSDAIEHEFGSRPDPMSLIHHVRRDPRTMGMRADRGRERESGREQRDGREGGGRGKGDGWGSRIHAGSQTGLKTHYLTAIAARHAAVARPRPESLLAISSSWLPISIPFLLRFLPTSISPRPKSKHTLPQHAPSRLKRRLDRRACGLERRGHPCVAAAAVRGGAGGEPAVQGL